MNYCKHKLTCEHYWYCDSRTNCYQECEKKNKTGVVDVPSTQYKPDVRPPKQ